MAIEKFSVHQSLVGLLYVGVLTVVLSIPASSTAAPVQTVIVNPPSSPVPVSGSVAVTNPASNPVQTQNVGGGATTQVGQLASKIVNLVGSGCNPFSISNSGSTAAFSVPSGQALVITDVQWYVPSGASTGQYDSLGIFTEPGGITFSVSALTDSNFIAAGQLHLGTGIVSPSGSTISGQRCGGGTIHMQGYLVPNQ